MRYFCYILECADGSYYTGWTTDPARREKQHNQGSGARYTRSHRPVKLAYLESVPDRSSAQRRELSLKALPHRKKQALILKTSQGVIMLRKLLPNANLLVTAPGRVNLLGEHVDYNDGWVLPAAIDRVAHILAEPRSDGLVKIDALDLQESATFSLAELTKKQTVDGKPLPSWALYPAGIAWNLQEHGLETKGFTAALTSNIPIGSGLSSSAAVEIGFSILWEQLGGWTLDRMTTAQYAQQAERQYVGVNCGLMDQFAVANGVEGHVVCLDTRTLDWIPMPLPANTSIVIADSGVRRSLTTSAYNERRASCEEAMLLLRPHLPGITALRDVSPAQFNQFARLLPEITRKRAQHVVEECARVQEALVCLQAGDADGFGRLMLAGHASLRDLYEVSTPELDALVETARNLPGCWGARLSGAGFGGCTVNLVQTDQAESFIQGLKDGYLAATGRMAEVYQCQASRSAYIESV